MFRFCSLGLRVWDIGPRAHHFKFLGSGKQARNKVKKTIRVAVFDRDNTAKKATLES